MKFRSDPVMVIHPRYSCFSHVDTKADTQFDELASCRAVDPALPVKSFKGKKKGQGRGYTFRGI